jgi:hypothetical protein
VSNRQFYDSSYKINYITVVSSCAFNSLLLIVLCKSDCLCLCKYEWKSENKVPYFIVTK